MSLSGQDVLLRMRDGDFPSISSSYSYQSAFSDGTVVPHQVMQCLLVENKIAAVEVGKRGAVWQLPHPISEET
jgi:hypothetical protein